jgi:hypothetical protein
MRRSACILVILSLQLGAAGCVEPLDVSQPIDLVPGRGWSAFQRQVLQDAAECWNVEFGTRLSLTDAPRAEQQVRVSISDFICAYANGLTSYFDDLEVQICSIDAASPSRLLTVMQHELGHVLNIREHADDRHAVMSEMDAASTGHYKEGKRFRREDRELFKAANPGFRPSGECAVAGQLGQSPSRPLVVNHPTRGPLSVIAGKSNLVVLAPQGAGSWREVARVPASGVAGWIRAIPNAAGMTVTWVVDDKMYAAEVAFDSEEEPKRVPLAVKHDFEKEVEDITIAAIGPDLFIGVTEGDLDSTFYLYRLDRATGQSRCGVTLEDTWGRVHAVGSVLALAVRDRGVRVLRSEVDPLPWFGAGFSCVRQVESLELESTQPHNALDAFSSEVVGGDLVVVHRRHEKPLRLHRVGVGSELRLLRSSEVPLPGKLGYTLASVAQGESGLAVAVNRVARQVFEVYVSQLDPETFGSLMPWTRLSTPDLSDSVQPWLAPQGGRFMAVWRDIHDIASIEVRSRCF